MLNAGASEATDAGQKTIMRILLVEPFSNETCFEFVNSAIGFAFNSENPFATNRSLVCVRYKFPCVVMNESIVLKIHGVAPIRMFQGLSIGGRFKRYG